MDGADDGNVDTKANSGRETKTNTERRRGRGARGVENRLETNKKETQGSQKTWLRWI